MPARTVQISIARPWPEVCDFLADPRNYLRWASWLGPWLRRRKGDWITEGPDGVRAKVRFTPPNPFGVADHCLLRAQDCATFIALRAIPSTAGTEVVLTFFGEPGWDEAQLAAQASAFQGELATLQALLERRHRPVAVAAGAAAAAPAAVRLTPAASLG